MITYDPRTRNHKIVWHNDPNLESLVCDLIEKLRPARFVETGTNMGWTSAWVAENFPDLPIFTIEVDTDYHAKSVENLAGYPNVFFGLGSSPAFLRSIDLSGLSLFWLDAHWWPPVPLREECSIISKLDRYAILIDDFFCVGFEGDTFDGTKNDLSYVADILGPSCWCPTYAARSDYKGYGLFLKGVNYTPPATMQCEHSKP